MLRVERNYHQAVEWKGVLNLSAYGGPGTPSIDKDQLSHAHINLNFESKHANCAQTNQAEKVVEQDKAHNWKEETLANRY